MVELDNDALWPARCLELDAGGARLPFENGLGLLGSAFEHVVILAEDLHGHIGTHALQHLVEAHFDRLGEFEGLTAIHLPPDLFDTRDQFLLGPGRAVALRPVLFRSVENVEIVLVGGHRVGRHFAGSDAREGVRHLRIMPPDLALRFLLDRETAFERHTDRPIHHRGDRPLVEPGRELRTERLEHQERRAEQDQRADHKQTRMRQPAFQHRRISAFGITDQPGVAPVLLLAGRRAQQPGGQRRGPP